MNYPADYLEEALNNARRLHRDAPARIDVSLAGDTGKGLTIYIKDCRTGNKISVPLRGAIDSVVRKAEDSIFYLLCGCSTPPDGVELYRPIWWGDTYVADEQDPVRAALQVAGAAEEKLADAVKKEVGRSVAVQPLDITEATIYYGEESVILPAHLADKRVIDAVDKWLRGDDRHLDTASETRTKGCRSSTSPKQPRRPRPSCAERHTGRGLTFRYKKIRLKASAQAERR